MGLDMYLSAEKYVSASDWRGEKDKFDELVKVLDAENFVGGFVPNVQVQVSVGYWRKANQIHQWFVDNCGRGEDDCRPYFVTREQLEELQKLCLEVLAVRYTPQGETVARDLLPPQQGFFFGEYEINDWYWEQLMDTVTQLQKALKEVPEGWDFQYHASW